MATRLVRVRMRQAVEHFVQVMDLERGAEYDLTATAAEQFIANGMADPVEREAEALGFEATALRPARRRG